MMRWNAWRVSDVYGTRVGRNTPTTQETTNPSDEVKAPDNQAQQVAVGGFRMPYEAMVILVFIGMLAAGWWITRKVG